MITGHSEVGPKTRPGGNVNFPFADELSSEKPNVSAMGIFTGARKKGGLQPLSRFDATLLAIFWGEPVIFVFTGG